MSGFEVVGVVLAVVPLCISALEHYEDEITPFKALFRYKLELSEARQTLFVVHTSFKKTIINLCQDAGVADCQQLERMIEATKANAWVSGESESKLENHLGDDSYQALQLMVRTICKSITKVAQIIGLDDREMLQMTENQGFRSDPWIGVAAATHAKPSLKPAGAFFTRMAAHEMKRRIKFILNSGTVQPLLEKVSKDTTFLDALIDKSSRPFAAMGNSGKKKTSKSTFIRPLDEIESQAIKLHRALESVWSCSKHQSHCVNLRLERRLRKQDNISKTLDNQTAFAIALKSSQTWRAMNIHIAEEPFTRSAGSVGFQPAISVLPASTITSQMQVIKDLCAAIEVPQTSSDCLSFCLDHNCRLLGNYPRTTTLADISTCHPVTLQDLLKTTNRSQTYSPKQAMMLSLTLVSSFLQLQSTPWLEDRWCAKDVILLRSSTSLDVEFPFISKMYPHSGCNTASKLSDCERMFALGIMLLEICTHTPIDDRRQPSTQLSNNMAEDASIVRSCLQAERDTWLDCFSESINACFKFYADLDLDLKDSATRAQVVDEVIYPFQRDLRW